MRQAKDSSYDSGTHYLNLKGVQENQTEKKVNQERIQSSLQLKMQTSLDPRPKTRLSKLLSRSISSEKSISSSAKEDDRVSDEQPTVLSSKEKLSGAEFLKEYPDEKSMLIYIHTNISIKGNSN